MIDENACQDHPDWTRPARVVVAAYCDECPVLKKTLNKEHVHYPLATGRE